MSELVERIKELERELALMRRIVVLLGEYEELARSPLPPELPTSSPVTLTNGTRWSNEAGGFVA